MKTLVIGLGNPILTDDGVGIYTARMVRHFLPSDTGIDVVELAVGGLDLMEAMVGYERVILIDALWSPPDEVGKVLLFDASDLPDTLNTANVHDANLPIALRTGRRLGAVLPDLGNIKIVAVQANEVLTFGEMPTPAVAAAIPKAAAEALQLLGYAPSEPLPPYQEIDAGGYDDSL